MANTKRLNRGRNHYTVTLTLFVLFLMFMVDPDSGFIQELPFGASALATLVESLKPVIAVTFIHYTRKWVFDYVDLGAIYNSIMASDDYMAKAMFSIAMAIFTLAFTIPFALTMVR